MQYSSTTVLAAFIAIFGLSNAHITMSSPEPFAFPVAGAGINPLDGSGSDFPCKYGSGGGYVFTTRTSMPSGSTQQLRFSGSATHGGGSCQVSLTKDLEPTPDSEWFVIHSIIGGCVVRNQEGNLVEGTTTTDAYDFVIPTDIAAGDYTLAWTWFNKIGFAEMYMNCAPITITGGAGAKAKRNDLAKAESMGFSKRQSAFPGMYVANVGPHGNGCNHDAVGWKGAGDRVVDFADPGPNPDYANGPDVAREVPPCGAIKGPGPVVGGSFQDQPVTQPETPPQTPPETAPEPVEPEPVVPEQPVEPVTPPPTVPEVVAPPPATGAGALSGACSPEGTYNCIGGTAFQQCASGIWSASIQMAAGTSCTPGQSATLW